MSKNSNTLLSGLSSTSSKIYLTSNNGSYHLVMQSDGNLVVYCGLNFQPHCAVFATGSNVSTGGPFTLVLELTGRLKIVNNQNISIWEQNSRAQKAPCSLVLTDSGKLNLIDGNHEVFWVAEQNRNIGVKMPIPTSSQTPIPYTPYTPPQPQPQQQPIYSGYPQPQQPLYPGYSQPMMPGYPLPPSVTPPPPSTPDSYPVFHHNCYLMGTEKLVSNGVNSLASPNRAYRFTINHQGDLTLLNLRNNMVEWFRKANGGVGPFSFIVQEDGNVVTYDSHNKAVFSTSTWQRRPKNPYVFGIHDDGYLYLTGNSSVVWSSRS